MDSINTQMQPHRESVDRMRADFEAWCAEARRAPGPVTDHSRAAATQLIQGQAVALTLLLSLHEAKSEIAMLRAELAERAPVAREAH